MADDLGTFLEPFFDGVKKNELACEDHVRPDTARFLLGSFDSFDVKDCWLHLTSETTFARVDGEYKFSYEAMMGADIKHRHEEYHGPGFSFYSVTDFEKLPSIMRYRNANRLTPMIVIVAPVVFTEEEKGQWIDNLVKIKNIPTRRGRPPWFEGHPFVPKIFEDKIEVLAIISFNDHE